MRTPLVACRLCGCRRGAWSLPGHGYPVSDLSREEALQRLQDAETAVRRVLQTIEREVHLASSGSEDTLHELLRTAARELELAASELRGKDPVSLVTPYIHDD
jgi:hypothetical protein